MTPKEKAFELVERYDFISTHDGLDIMDEELTMLDRKQCALIAVDEMILVLPFTDTNATLNYYAIHLQKYLEQVKHEIQKL